MKRYAVACATLTLLALLSIVGPTHAAWLALPEAESQNAQFEVLEATLDQTVLSWSAGSLEVAENEQGNATYRLAGIKAETNDRGEPQITRMVRLPWGRSASMQVTGGVVSHISPEGALLGTVGLSEAPYELEDWANLGQSGVFRDVTVAPLLTNPVKIAEDGSAWVASSLQFVLDTDSRLEGVSSQAPTQPVSRAFWPMYQELLTDDLDDLGSRLATTRGTYFIVIHSSYLAYIEQFVEWKKQKGYTVDIHTTESNISFDQLRTLIRDTYYNADPPLEYVLLVGDVNRGQDVGAAIPSGLITNPNLSSENDVTDWRYVNIEGDDYYPEVFIGRMTAGSSSDAFRISSRVVKYEQNSSNIPLDDPYFNTAHLVAANYSEGGLTPLTPVATTRWLQERMEEDWNIDNVNLFSWEQDGHQATPEEILAAINATGGLWVTYRGWGNATEWVQPNFDNGDVGNLANTFRLPVLTSFVCNTGDFGNSANPESFGERWLVAGSPNQPAGAVAVVAPSDLHTQTAYNNSLIAGFYSGVYTDHLTNISQALLRAKLEIFNNFPLNRASGEEVEFYWHVYHVLGDPELSMWRHAPREMTVTIPDEVVLGQDYLEVSATGVFGPLRNAYVQLIQGETVFAGGYTDESGVAAIPFDDIELGTDLQVTVSRAEYLPQIFELPVVQAPRYVGLASWDVDAGTDGLVSVDESIGLTVTLKNDGSEAVSGISAVLSSANEELISITSSESTFGDMSAGATADNASSPFAFSLESALQDGAMIELELTITDADDREWATKVWVPVGTSSMEYLSYETTGGSFEPGESPNITFTFENIGSVPAENLTATMLSWDEAVTVTSGEVSNVSIAAGGSGTVGPFTVSVDEDTYRGRVVRFEMLFSKDGTEIDRLNFAVPLEGAVSTDPFGPDSHGYFIYDDTDSQWEEAPTFQWFDLAEDENATQYNLLDDDNVTVELPFDFTFYGREYLSGSPMTISSNGWISFKEESEYTANYFRNWGIPSSLGPTGMIAAFWDDLKYPFGSTTISVFTRYDEAEGRFIIEWADALNRFGHDQEVAYPEYFEIVLYDQETMQTTTGDGVIEIYYNEVNNIDQKSNYATVGLLNRLRTVGLEYTYANLYPAAAAPLEDGRALRITTNAPDVLNDVPERRNETTSPDDFVLYQSYPNPFNSATEIAFDIPEAGDVRLSVYNLLGQEIAVLIDRPMAAGHKQVVWQVNDLNLSSGLLLVRLQASNRVLWNKMMYVK